MKVIPHRESLLLGSRRQFVFVCVCMFTIQLQVVASQRRQLHIYAIYCIALVRRSVVFGSLKIQLEIKVILHSNTGSKPNNNPS